MNMKKLGLFLSWFLVLILLIQFLILPSPSNAMDPFGGDITNIVEYGPGTIDTGYCQEGMLVTLGSPSSGDYMYVPGSSKSYAFGPPKRTGQWLLGMSSGFLTCTTWWYCGEDICEIPSGGGEEIIFHGSSN